MAAVSKIITVVLHIVQIICAISIIGIASNYIATHKSRSLGHLSRFIFADVVAVISTFFAVIWLIPFSSNYMNWYIDALLGVFSAAMAGWLVYSSEKLCGEINRHDAKAVLDFDDVGATWCTKWKALYVFAIISVALWIISAAVGYFWVKKNMKAAKSHYKPSSGGRRPRARR
ncbi:uncharacterized protein FIESC28_01962 [Fusarium coffeatum]|uniref:MARVEL domain-containing protein n=1 Tax=Fusarium coffeatum TaxID=231269 RepID=A0A366S7C0_9HYPO|nr:uncharacterized protein FIESC28_01962 [Fusarium coffeatum]RBR25227.1 hypothetical protein FIESC28_01962 [Fusarium coffeatum]